MPFPSRLLAIAALAVPLLAVGSTAQDARPDRPGMDASPTAAVQPGAAAPFDTLERARHPGWQHQVRVERRIVIRIGPAPADDRREMLADLPRRPLRSRYAEVDHAGCIEADEIIGVQPSPDNRLLFYTDESQILAARLQSGCSARAYYAGFYIERSGDGRLCVDRDRLQSRAGGSCQVQEFTRLVAAAD